jgi:hypothetical protein
MNPKYTTAGLALGILVALASETTLAQNSKPQARQKNPARSASSIPQAADSKLSDLPIGVLQGIEDAKRYQELVRRAERLGQPAPPLPYAASTSRLTAAPPTTAGQASPPSASVAPSQPPISNSPTPGMSLYQPGAVPVFSAPASSSQPMQYLQSPQLGPVRTDMTFGYARPQPTTPQPHEQIHQNLREQVEALYQILNNLSGQDGGDVLDFSLPAHAPSTPAHQPISMPGPAPTHLPFGRRP